MKFKEDLEKKGKALRSTKMLIFKEEKKKVLVESVVVNKIEFNVYLNNIKLESFICVNTKFY